MLSTIKPIVVTLSGMESASGTYLEYDVKMRYNTDSYGGVDVKTLYHGKSFIDAYGNTEIHLEKVLRDYLFRWECGYDPDSQAMRPKRLTGSMSQSINAVEYENALFWNTKIDVVYEFNHTEQTVTLDVCGSWCPAFQKMGVICSPLEGLAITDYVQNYAMLATNEPPHIPPVATSKFWLGLVMNINQACEGSVGRIAIGADSVNNTTVLYRHGGTYAVAWTLAQLFSDMLEDEIDGGASGTTGYYDSIEGGGAGSTYSGDIDGGTSDDNVYARGQVMAGVTLSLYWNVDGVLYSTPVAVVDTCAKPYYVAWLTPTGGWTAIGMDGNCTIETRNTQTSIVNLLDATEVLSVKEEAVFTLHSGMVKRDMYAHLMTMLSSRLVYVYDVKNDTGYYCRCNTGNATTLPSKTGKMQSFEVQMTATNSNEQ